MPLELAHDLKPDAPLDTRARQDFISSLRGFILNDMATDMQSQYQASVEPKFRKAHGHAPRNQDEVHDAMREDLHFKV
jgi:hypothetical protein